MSQHTELYTFLYVPVDPSGKYPVEPVSRSSCLFVRLLWGSILQTFLHTVSRNIAGMEIRVKFSHGAPQSVVDMDIAS